MMKLEVIDKNGKKTSRKVSLKGDIFGIDPSDHAIYLDVKQYLANQRQGTHKAKERNEIKGSTKKIRKQKGTGGARFGDIKNPLFKGGGRVFGPKPRDYGFKVNKKVKQLARKSALSYKAKDQAITVLEDFRMETPKTKEYIAMLDKLAVSDKKVLMVLKEQDNNIYLSSRNHKKARVVTADQLNTYDILNANNLILSESSVARIEELLAK